MPILLILQQQQFGDISFSGAEIAFLVFIVGPLLGSIVGMAKYIVNGKDKEIATLKELLRVNTRTTERSVKTADKSVTATERSAALSKDQIAELAAALYDLKQSKGL